MAFDRPVNKFVKRDSGIMFEIMDLKREIPELEKELKLKKLRLAKLENK